MHVNRFNHTGYLAVVNPTDRPKSVRNSWVIKVFGGVLCCQLVVEFSVGIRIPLYD